jgi:hypothetical protein
MSWRHLAERLDKVAVRTFDRGGIAFQKMNGLVPVGASVAIPAEFDGNFKQIDVRDGVEVLTSQPVAWIHYADFTAQSVALPAKGDQLIVPSGDPFAGTYVVSSAEQDSDGTGATLRLVKAHKT